jgi:hypothetical protein
VARIAESQKVLDLFDNCGEGAKFHFSELKTIIKKVGSARVALAYCFQQIESGHRRALYAAILRKYRFDPDKT